MRTTLTHTVTLATLVIALGSAHLTQAVTADGKPLPAGTYEVRVTDESPTPAVGQTAGSEKWVEFMQGGKVVGRELASVLSSADVADRSQRSGNSAPPRSNRSRVDVLKGGDYVRVWMNQGQTHYLINLRTARPFLVVKNNAQ